MQDYLTPQYNRFALYVVDCFRHGDYAIAEGFMGPDYIVNKARMERADGVSKAMNWPDNKQGENEWSLTLTSWVFGLFPRVSLMRGEQNYKVQLTRAEHRGLAELVRCAFDDRKRIAKEAKLAYKQQQMLSQWVEVDPQPMRIANA